MCLKGEECEFKPSKSLIIGMHGVQGQSTAQRKDISFSWWQVVNLIMDDRVGKRPSWIIAMYSNLGLSLKWHSEMATVEGKLCQTADGGGAFYSDSSEVTLACYWILGQIKDPASYFLSALLYICFCRHLGSR